MNREEKRQMFMRCSVHVIEDGEWEKRISSLSAAEIDVYLNVLEPRFCHGAYCYTCIKEWFSNTDVCGDLTRKCPTGNPNDRLCRATLNNLIQKCNNQEPVVLNFLDLPSRNISLPVM